MFDGFFDLSGLEPHGFCLSWRPNVFWTLVGADAAIAVAYFLISTALMVFLWKRRDVSLRGIGAMFAAFILLCAASHVSDILTMWLPEYGSQIVIKIATATVSLITAAAMWKMMPEALLIPTVQKMLDTEQSLHVAKEGLLRDALTGTWNRAKLHESAADEMQRFFRYGHPVSLIFIDLDHFKRVNDTHGHAVGDDVLRQFCRIVSHGMRSTDLLGRWGGEEFLIIAPSSSLETAAAMAERICHAIGISEFPAVGHLTASFGVATCQPDDTWDLWLSRADRALYEAKNTGRNRVVTDQIGYSSCS